MSKNLGRLTGAAAIAAAVMAFGVPAKADGVKVGVLSCHESSGWGFIFGSSKGLRCMYHHGGYSERYNGSVSKFGVDIGYTSGAVIIWDVFAPNAGPERGALSGDYVGVQASAAAGPGAGASSATAATAAPPRASSRATWRLSGPLPATRTRRPASTP